MNQFLKISGSGVMGLHALALLASNPEQWRCNRKLAERLKVSEHSLSAALQILRREGLIQSVRGARGGYMLARESRAIRLLEIYEALEGKFAQEECLLGHRICPGGPCILSDFPDQVQRQFRAYLGRTRLSEIAETWAEKGSRLR